MKNLYFIFGRVGVLALLGAGVLSFAIDRKPMAINIVNALQTVPRELLDAAREGKKLNERSAWEAVQYYEDRLVLDPHDIGAMTSLGYIYIGLDDYSKAMSWYQRASKADPQLWGINYNLAYIQYKTGHEKAAYELLSSLLKSPPVLRKDCIFLIGTEGLNEDNLHRVIERISLMGVLSAKVPLDQAGSLFDGFFDDGLFYYAFVRQYSVNGKSGFVLF